MGVAPDGEFAAVDIAVGYIHSADVAYRAVDDADFSVVAPVDASAERRERDLEERIGAYAFALHFFEEACAGAERADMVIDDPDFDPGVAALDEYIANLAADMVVLEYIILYID